MPEYNITDASLIKLSSNVRRSADRILRATNLIKRLREFGRVEIEGSYSYSLMISPDIDIRVTAESGRGLGFDARGKIAAELLTIRTVRRLQMSDRYHFDHKTGALIGIWFGLGVDHDDERPWNVDIWVVDRCNSQPPQAVDLDGLQSQLQHLNPFDRTTILRIKYAMSGGPHLIKGFTSSDIYHAVLLEKIGSLEGYVESRNIK